MPTLPDDFPIVLLAEFLFGVGFNQLVAWGHRHKLWHVSVSVTVGVIATLLIAMSQWWNVDATFLEAVLWMTACFSASGTPMIAGSMGRDVKDRKKRRPLPNHAIRIRDEVVMELKAMLNEIVEGKAELVSVVHRLHEVVGWLKGM